MSLAIRLAGPQDKGALTDLLQQLNAVEDAITADRKTDRETATRHIGDLEQWVREQEGEIIVAAEGGTVVGAAVWGVLEDDIYVRDGVRTFAYVSDLVVADGHRRRGVGAMLLHSVEAAARARGLRRLVIGALAGNDAAIAAYRKAGFTPYAVELLKEL